MPETTSSGRAKVTLPADTQILITRDFDAPRHLVWRAYTEPELVSRWWPGRRGEMKSAEIDLRVGGKWRYVMVAHEGFEVAFNGEFREIVQDERIVNTEAFEGAPGTEPALVTVTFSETGGRTALAMLMEVSSREVRDMIVETGMETGVQEGMDILEQLARTLS
jgi:uncharacterized protein YndB with AHSA1/START domain